MPTASTISPRRACPECGTAFAATHHRQTFCSPAHQRAYGNRQLARGQAIVSLAQAWRGSRSSKHPEAKEIGRTAFTLLCRLVDQHNAEDREAGRVPATAVLKQRMAMGTMD